MAATRVGFCGLGTMGSAMAASVARAGSPLEVWDRTPGRAGMPVSRGAIEVATARETAAESEVIGCSGIALGATREHAARQAARGVSFVDAPVSGGPEGARTASLTITVGGEAVAEGIVLAVKAGLGAERVVSALSAGAARSWVLEDRSGRMIADDDPAAARAIREWSGM